MSKYQEALSSITFTMHLRVKPKALSICEDENLDLLQELVDRATPTKCSDYLKDKSMARCPHCHQPQLTDEKIPFCEQCGQKLDWEK